MDTLDFDQFVPSTPSSSSSSEPDSGLNFDQFVPQDRHTGPVTAESNSPEQAEPASQESGIASIAGRAFKRGMYDAITGLGQTAEVATGNKDQIKKATGSDDPELDAILNKSLGEGWTDPRYWVARIVKGTTESFPTLAATIGGGLVGGALTSETGPGAAVGAVGGAAAAGAIASGAQTLGPAFQRAINEDLKPEDAFERAWAETGIASVIGGAMGALPGYAAWGKTAEGALKAPIKEALFQIFGVQPAAGAVQQVATNAVEGKSTSPEEIVSGYLDSAATGAALTAGHRAVSGKKKADVEPVPEKGPDPAQAAALNPDTSTAAPAQPSVVDPSQAAAASAALNPTPAPGKSAYVVSPENDPNTGHLNGQQVTIDPEQPKTAGNTRVILPDGSKQMVPNSQLKDSLPQAAEEAKAATEPKAETKPAEPAAAAPAATPEAVTPEVTPAAPEAAPAAPEAPKPMTIDEQRAALKSGKQSAVLYREDDYIDAPPPILEGQTIKRVKLPGIGWVDYDWKSGLTHKDIVKAAGDDTLEQILDVPPTAEAPAEPAAPTASVEVPTEQATVAQPPAPAAAAEGPQVGGSPAAPTSEAPPSRAAEAVESLPPVEGPSFDDARALLPKDANGDTDYAVLKSIIKDVAGAEKAFNALTGAERAKVVSRLRSMSPAEPVAEVAPEPVPEPTKSEAAQAAEDLPPVAQEVPAPVAEEAPAPAPVAEAAPVAPVAEEAPVTSEGNATEGVLKVGPDGKRVLENLAQKAEREAQAKKAEAEAKKAAKLAEKAAKKKERGSFTKEQEAKRTADNEQAKRIFAENPSNDAAEAGFKGRGKAARAAKDAILARAKRMYDAAVEAGIDIPKLVRDSQAKENMNHSAEMMALREAKRLVSTKEPDSTLFQDFLARGKFAEAGDREAIKQDKKIEASIGKKDSSFDTTAENGGVAKGAVSEKPVTLESKELNPEEALIRPQEAGEELSVEEPDLANKPVAPDEVIDPELAAKNAKIREEIAAKEQATREWMERGRNTEASTATEEDIQKFAPKAKAFTVETGKTRRKFIPKDAKVTSVAEAIAKLKKPNGEKLASEAEIAELANASEESAWASRETTLDKVIDGLNSSEFAKAFRDAPGLGILSRKIMDQLMPTLLAKLKQLAPNTKVMFLPDHAFDLFDPLHKEGKRAGGYYDTASDTIVLRESSMDNPIGYARTMAHEAAHAAFQAAIKSDAVLRGQIEALMKIVGREVPKGTYAMRNVHEFISEAWSNPEFQRKLANISMLPRDFRALGLDMSKLGRIKSALDMLKTKLADVLGLRKIFADMGQKRPTNAFDVAMEISNSLMEIAPEARRKWAAGERSGFAEDEALPAQVADLKESAKEKAEEFRTAFVDYNRPIERAQEGIQALLGQLPEVLRFFERKRLLEGRTIARLLSVARRESEAAASIAKWAKEGGFKNAKELTDTLKARYAETRNAQLRAQNSNSKGTGMDDATATALMDAVRNDPVKQKAFDKIAKLNDDMREEIFDILKSEDLMTQKEIDHLKQNFKNYTSFEGFADDALAQAVEDANGTTNGRRKLSVMGDEYRKAEGRDTESDDPIHNMFGNLKRAIERSEQVRVTKSMAEAARRAGYSAGNPDSPFYVAGPSDPRVGGMQHAYDDPRVVPFKENGKTQYLVFKDEALAKAVMQLAPADLNAVARAADRATNVVKAGWTHYSLVFLIRHFIFRYPIEAAMNIQAIPGASKNPLTYLKDSFKMVPDVHRFLRGDTVKDARVAKYMKEMTDEGGVVSFGHLSDTDAYKNQLKRIVEGKSTNPLVRFHEAWQLTLNAADTAERLSAYIRAREAGFTAQKAALMARDITVDFSRKGNHSRSMNVWVPFGNVAIQTTARIANNVRSPAYRRTLYAMVAGSAAVNAMNYLVGGNDKDGTPWIEKVPSYERNQNLILMMPWKDSDGVPVTFKVPLPYPLFALHAAGNAATNFAMSQLGISKMDGGDIASGVVHGVAETFTPLGHQINSLWELATPEVARFVSDIYANENPLGGPIHTEHPKKGMPRSEQGFKTTGDGWKEVAKLLAKVGIDRYPEDIEYTAKHFVNAQLTLGSSLGAAIPKVVVGGPTDKSDLKRFYNLTAHADIDSDVMQLVQKKMQGRLLTKTEREQVDSILEHSGMTARQLVAVHKAASEFKSMRGKKDTALSAKEQDRFLRQKLTEFNRLGITGGFH